MFPSTLDIAEKIFSFFILGIIFGLLYEMLRFVRCLFKLGRIYVNITDCLYIAFSSVVLFISVIGGGEGQIRLYHILGALSGFLLYIFTLGRFFYFINSKICVLLRRFFSRIFKPILTVIVKKQQKFCRYIVDIYKKLTIRNKKTHSDLQNVPNIMYNRNNNTTIMERSGLRNVIKAKIK